jgi:hypothetical protein
MVTEDAELATLLKVDVAGFAGVLVTWRLAGVKLAALTLS